MGQACRGEFTSPESTGRRKAAPTKIRRGGRPIRCSCLIHEAVQWPDKSGNYNKNVKTVHEQITRSPEETRVLGKKIGRKLREGDVVALIGELGAGKTCLAQGLGWGLGVDPNLYLTSPSFTLIREYHGRLRVYHIDLYRLNSIEEVYELGFEEYFYGSGVTIVEWADRIETLLPPEHVRIEIGVVSENERQIKLLYPRD